jgi:hypothetical protein
VSFRFSNPGTLNLRKGYSLPVWVSNRFMVLRFDLQIPAACGGEMSFAGTLPHLPVHSVLTGRQARSIHQLPGNSVRTVSLPEYSAFLLLLQHITIAVLSVIFRNKCSIPSGIVRIAGWSDDSTVSPAVDLTVTVPESTSTCSFLAG